MVHVGGAVLGLHPRPGGLRCFPVQGPPEVGPDLGVVRVDVRKGVVVVGGVALPGLAVGVADIAYLIAAPARVCRDT